MAITSEAQVTEAVVEAFRGFTDQDLQALRWQGGIVAARTAELVIGERAHKEALLDELAQARSDVAQLEQHVAWRKSALKKSPTGTERLVLEDELKQYETRLAGALGNAEACEQEIAKA